MAIPVNITKDHLLAAIEKIDKEGIPKDGESRYYDLVYNGKMYPPKLVLSYSNLFANSEILDRNSFSGGLETQCFKILEDNGFMIIKKEIDEQQTPNLWIEKTLTKRDDRLEGDRALGKALWSPQKDKRGADIYKNMLLVKKGDVVLHLIDNKSFCGLSKVVKSAVETTGLAGTQWEGPSYLIELEDFNRLDYQIDVKTKILNDINKHTLLEINKKSEVFYTQDLKLRQGAYLTPCPIELFELISNAYKANTGKDMPFTDEVLNIANTTKQSQTFEYKAFIDKVQKANLKFSKSLILRFMGALLTKPFVILTGLSGSGKTKLAHSFALWICETEGQYCIVPVGADWTNREPLLGFPNALDINHYVLPDNRGLSLMLEASKPENQSKPYFLILDEMNLSHVERYFADFLSVMESNDSIKLYQGTNRKGSDGVKVPVEIKWPNNLFVIGTVNIDETTYMFSPKVLDRASVIEFRVTTEEMRNYLSSQSYLDLENLKSSGANMAESFVEIASDKLLQPSQDIDLQNALIGFFSELKKTGAEFGYRTASEISRYAAVVNTIESNWTVTEIIDAAIMQKLLPKVHGSRRKLEPVLKTLGSLCLDNDLKIDELISSKTEIDFNDNIRIKYPISLEKILRMYHSLIDNGFTSYAEA
jgi:5-methylcytosine-specific restriction protein B